MQATVRRNEGLVRKWTDGLSRATGEAVVRDLLQFEGFMSHDNWIGRPGSIVAWVERTTDLPTTTNGKVIAHETVVLSPKPPARNPRSAKRPPPGFHRRSSIQSTRPGLAARVGKR